MTSASAAASPLKDSALLAADEEAGPKFARPVVNQMLHMLLANAVGLPFHAGQRGTAGNVTAGPVLHACARDVAIAVACALLNLGGAEGFAAAVAAAVAEEMGTIGSCLGQKHGTCACTGKTYGINVL
jgi:hypothetical protein